MQVGITGCNASTRGAHDKALLDQVRLEDIFDGTALLTDRSRQIVDTYRPAIELFNNGLQ